MIVCGEVTKIKNGMAYVSTPRPVSCEGCAASGACKKTEIEICAVNDIGADVGDKVDVESDEKGIALWLMAFIFLIPVILLFVGVWLCSVSPWLLLIILAAIIGYLIFLVVLNKKWIPSNRIIAIKKQ